MAQFTVYSNAQAGDGSVVRYLLDVQSDLVGKAATCVVVPLIALDRVPRPVEGLMPVFELDGAPWVMDTLQLAGVSRRILGPAVADLSHERARILAALDVLISGI